MKKTDIKFKNLTDDKPTIHVGDVRVGHMFLDGDRIGIKLVVKDRFSGVAADKTLTVDFGNLAKAKKFIKDNLFSLHKEYGLFGL